MKTKIFLTSLFMSLSITLMAQPFNTVVVDSMDFNHYSNETTRFGEYVFAGTRFMPGDNDIHVFKMDVNGVMMWERFVNLGPDDRALDIMEDPTTNELVIVGYTDLNGPREMYALKLDAGGGFIADQIINGWPHPESAGTNVIFSNQTGNYVVGGFYTDFMAYPLQGNGAVVIELDPALNPTGQAQTFVGPTQRHASVNDIVEYNGGYFVTGSMDFLNGFNQVRQGVLAVFIDPAFNLMADLSFESTNWEHVGVSAVYKDWQDRLYLMSNNSVIHNPQITIFSNVSGGPVMGPHYFLELDPSYGTNNAAGFELRASLFDPDRLVAAGLFRTYPNFSPPNDNATLWVAEFWDGNGVNVNTHISLAASSGFHTHGGGIFSTFSGEHPYVYNQELLTYSQDNISYVTASSITQGSYYALDIISTNGGPGASTCLDTIGYDTVSWSHFPIKAVDFQPPFTDNPPSVPSNVINTPTLNPCNVFFKDGTVKESAKEQFTDFTIVPNPFNNEVLITIPEMVENGTVTIANTVGKVVFRESGLNGENLTRQVDLGHLAPGIYLLQLEQASGSLTKRIVKQ